MANWQVNQARNHLSEVLDQAESEGPQVITHHGKERAVVLSIDSYRSLKPKEEKPDFISFLLNAPKVDFDDSIFERDHSTEEHREVPFSGPEFGYVAGEEEDSL